MVTEKNAMILFESMNYSREESGSQGWQKIISFSQIENQTLRAHFREIRDSLLWTNF